VEDVLLSHLACISIPAESQQSFWLVQFVCREKEECAQTDIVSIAITLLEEPVNISGRGDAGTLTSGPKQLVKVLETSVDVLADDGSRILIIDDQNLSHRRIEVSHKF
jgi:hypothetical protein